MPGRPARHAAGGRDLRHLDDTVARGPRSTTSPASRSARPRRRIVQSLFVAMGLVFVAEMGDKTQIVALGFGTRHRLAPVLTGVALAYMCTNLVSVLIGGLLGATLPTRAIGLAGGRSEG